MNERDDELTAWQAEWRAEAPPAPEIRQQIAQRVRRRIRNLILLTLGELALVVVAVTLLLGLSRTNPHPLDQLTLWGLAILSFAALLFSLWNRRGLFRPSAASTADFLAHLKLACRRRLLGVRAAWVLLAAEALFFLPWTWHRLHLDPARPAALGRSLGTWAFVAADFAAAVAVVVILRRRTLREMAELEDLERGLGEG